MRISKRAGDWYISFKYEEQPNQTTKERDIIGVDVGINALATCSYGSKYANVKAYKQAKKRLTPYQRRVNEKEPGSKNRAKAIKKLAILHKKVADIRADALHKLTTWLAKNHNPPPSPPGRGARGVGEDLNVSGMLKNHKLASAIADCGFYEFKRQLTYKCELYGSELIIADRFYPSSQLCSQCGHQQKMPLSERLYECGNCGFKADRDFNAAVNLENYANQ